MTNSNLVIRLLTSLREKVEILKPLRDSSLKELTADPLRWNGLLHLLQVCIEHVTDICAHLLADNGFDVPDNHRLVIRKVGEVGFLSPEFAESIAPMTGFRNIVVHHYLSLDPKIVAEILQKRLPDFDEFIAQIYDHLRKTGNLPTDENTE